MYKTKLGTRQTCKWPSSSQPEIRLVFTATAASTPALLISVFFIVTMQDTAPAVYTLAVFVIIVYILDFVVQWRNIRRPQIYTYLQLFLIGLFIAGGAVLITYNQKEAKMSLLHGLQGLSLLQSLILEAMMSSRLYLGLDNYLDRRRAFPWVHSLTCIITVAFCVGAFTSILHDVDDKDLSKGRILLLVGTNVAHAFLTCLTFQQHKFSGIPHTPTFFWVVIVVNWVTLSINALLLLLPGVTGFLLGQTIVSFTLGTAWVGLITYNFEWRKDKGTTEQKESREVQVDNASTTDEIHLVVEINASSDDIGNVADLEIQTPPTTAYREGQRIVGFWV